MNMSQLGMMNDLYKFFGAARSALPWGRELWRGNLTDRAFIMSKESAFVLSLARDFISTADLALSASRAWPGELRPLDAWHSDIQTGIANGFLLSKNDVKALLCRSLSTDHGPTGVRCVAIPTRDRPDCLERLLTQLSREAHAFKHQPRVIVFDDSLNEASGAENRSVVSRLGSNQSMRVDFWDRCDREDFARSLAARTGIPVSTVRFGLIGSPEYCTTVGACRNAALLACAGLRFLFADDDVELKVNSIPGSSSAIKLGSSLAKYESWPLAECLTKFKDRPDDVLGAHDRALTFDPAVLAAQFARGDVDVTGRFLKHVRKTPGRIITAQMGIAGDPAIDSPLSYYFQSVDSMARMGVSEDGYRRTLSAFEVLRGSPNFTLSEEVAVVSYCVALNNTDILPPFLPVLRGEELVFDSLVNRCIPGALSASLPCAIRHNPPPGRVRSQLSLAERIGQLNSSALVTALISSVAVPQLSARDALRWVGNRLKEIGSLPDAEFRSTLMAVSQPLLIHWVSELEARIGSTHIPDVWLEDATRIRDSIISTWNDSDVSAPMDMCNNGKPADARKRFRNLLGEFADLLYAWPELFDAAHNISAQFTTIGEQYVQG